MSETIITDGKVGQRFICNNGAIVEVLSGAKYNSKLFQCLIYEDNKSGYKWFYYESGRVCSKGEEYDFKEWIMS